MSPADASRFAPRPVVTLLDELADAFSWPRSRPARLLGGDRAQLGARFVLCSSDAALVGLEAPDDAVAICAVAPEAGEGRAGRRTYDPFLGMSDDIASWRRGERVVLDAALLVAGGAGGVDERIAADCGLEPLDGLEALEPIRPVDRDARKFVGYVPADVADAVTTAVFAAGAGTIGAYDLCSWSTAGTGTFRGGEGTNPAIGERGALERVDEIRFEVVVPTQLVPRVLRAYRAAHPYEEPAFDVYDLRIPAAVGFGRVGRLGRGGGAAVWNTLGAIDPELTVHGRADHAGSGAICAIHTGAVRDVLSQLLDIDELAIVVAGAASDAELDLLAGRGVAVLVLDRTRAVDAHAVEIAGHLSRLLTLPTTVAGALRFPASDASGSGAGSGAGSGSGSDSGSDAAGATADDGDEMSLWGRDAPVEPAGDFGTGTWRLHFDGGSRGNPGPAAYGWVIYDPNGNEAIADGVKCGRTTNNVAEWTGLLRGLEHAAQVGIRRLAVRGDSELVVKQVTGVYRVKNAALKPLAEQVKTMIGRFDHVDIAHVYRADNARADAVANEAMDGLR